MSEQIRIQGITKKDESFYKLLQFMDDLKKEGWVIDSRTRSSNVQEGTETVNYKLIRNEVFTRKNK